MAKDYEINLKVNTGSSVDDLNDLENVLSGISDELVPLTTQMGDMEDKLMLMAYAGDTTSDEFKRLSHEVAGMRKSIRETDTGIEALSMTTSQKLSGALGGVTAGFETFQGAMGAFGVESEEVEAALLKVQSAMALTQGIQGIKEALPSIKSLGSGAVQTFKTMTAAGKAFALTGVGLLLTALAAAAEAMSSYSEESADAAVEVKRLESAVESLNTQLEFGTAQLDAATRTKIANAKMAGKSELDLLKIEADAAQESINLRWENANERIKANNEIIQNEFATAEQFKAANDDIYKARTEQQNMKAEAVAISAELNLKEQEILQQQAETEKQRLADAAAERKAALDAWKDAQKAVLEEITQANYDYLNSKKSAEDQEVIAANDKWDALIKDAKKYKLDTKQLLLNKEEEEKAIRQKYADEVIALEKEKQDALNQLIKDALQQDLQAREDYDQAYYEATTSAQQLELDAVGEKYFYLVEMAKQYGLDTTQLEADRLIKEKEINDKYAEEKKAADQKILDDQKAATEAENNLRIQAASDTFTTLNNLTTLFAGKSEKAQKRAFQIQKAVSVAQAIMDTYKAANVALGSAPPPFNYIAMAAAITTGLVNVKTIMAQKFEGAGTTGGAGGGTSAGGGGTTNVMTPNFNVVGNSGLNQLAQVAGQPIQAYVVSGQITTAQSLDRNKIENATL